MMEKAEFIDRKAPPKGKVTFEEFLDLADEAIHAEWEDGEVIFMSPASRKHQDLNDWLVTILRIFIRRHNLGEILSAPFTVQLKVTQQGREPDLIFLKTENLGRLHDTYLEGSADLVIEIVSPESVSRDRGRKFVEYESEGIPEYWLVDPIRQQAEFYRLGNDDHYHLSLPDAEGVYHSLSVTGFWLKIDWLWQDSLPDELEVLRQLGVLEE